MVLELDIENQSRFQAIRPDLFADDTIDALALYINSSDTARPNSIISESIVDISSLRLYFGQIKNRNTLLIIRQDHSWGRFRITYPAFKEIVDFLRATVEFLDVVGCFGVKTSEDERVLTGYKFCTRQKQCPHEQHAQPQSQGSVVAQTDWVVPPIVRQFVNIKLVLINPNNDLKSRIGKTSNAKFNQCYLTLHVELLLSTGYNWTEYIEYLNSGLRKHNIKACYSTVEHIKDNGFSVSYTDLQALHTLQNKIHRAEAAIESSIEVAKGCIKHYSCHTKAENSSLSSKISRNQLHTYIADMNRQRQSLRRLNRSLRNTLGLLSKILMFRNEELLHTANRASGQTLGTLLDITESGRCQQEALANLASNSQADSTMLKALSIVATVCLPASLVANIFSSTLIQSISETETGGKTHLALSPQFWTYAVITLPLVAITLVWILYLSHKSRSWGLTIEA